MRFTHLAAATAIGFASLLIGGVSYAEQTTSDATTSAASPADDETIVCRRIQEVGSNVRKKKVCMTRAEWAKLNDQSKEFERESEEPQVYTPNGQLIGPVGNN